MSGMNTMPDIPDMPGNQEMRTSCGMSGMSGMPDEIERRRMPGIPGELGMPGMHGMPGVPRLRGGGLAVLRPPSAWTPASTNRPASLGLAVRTIPSPSSLLPSWCEPESCNRCGSTTHTPLPGVPGQVVGRRLPDLASTTGCSATALSLGAGSSVSGTLPP